MMKRRIGLVIVLSAMVAGLCIIYPHLQSRFGQTSQPRDRQVYQSSPPGVLQVAQAYPSPVKRHRVAALGRLLPEGRILDIGTPARERLGRLLVQEGQLVSKGDELAYLESRAEHLAETAYAESQLRDAEARLSAETAYAQASIAEATMRLKQLREVPLLDIRAQEAQVRRLEADVAGALTDLHRLEGLHRKGTISQQEVDHQRLHVHRLREEINQTTALLKKRQTEYTTNVSLARASLNTAQANLVRVQANLQLSTLKQNLARSQARLARSVLRAPINGRILQIVTYPGESLGQQPLLKMANTQHMYAIAEVYETDIGLIQVGQRAQVSSPALPRGLSGRVVHIGRTIGKNGILSVDPAAATDARVAEVKIQLDQSEVAARLLNLQVDVVIDMSKSARPQSMARH